MLKFEFINHMWQYSLIAWPLQQIQLVILLYKSIKFFLCNKELNMALQN